MKRAQMPGQIFVYILAMIIVGGIVLYGYTAIKDFGDRGEQVAFLSFKTDFENTVKTMVSDYGSIKRPDFDVPKQYRKVCIVDFKKGADPTGEGYTCVGAGSDDYEPLVCNAWEQGSQTDPTKTTSLSNVFLTPDGSDSFNVPKITLSSGGHETGMLCARVKNGKVKMQFKSLGDSVEISVYE